MWSELHERQWPNSAFWESSENSVLRRQNYPCTKLPSALFSSTLGMRGNLPWEPTYIELNLFRRKLCALCTANMKRILSFIYTTSRNRPVLKLVGKVIAWNVCIILCLTRRVCRSTNICNSTLVNKPAYKHSKTVSVPYCIKDCLSNSSFVPTINN